MHASWDCTWYSTCWITFYRGSGLGSVLFRIAVLSSFSQHEHKKQSAIGNHGVEGNPSLWFATVPIPRIIGTYTGTIPAPPPKSFHISALLQIDLQPSIICQNLGSTCGINLSLTSALIYQQVWVTDARWKRWANVESQMFWWQIQTVISFEIASGTSYQDCIICAMATCWWRGILLARKATMTRSRNSRNQELRKWLSEEATSRMTGEMTHCFLASDRMTTAGAHDHE